jgi:ATP-binding cassette subfamily B protein
MDRGKIIDVGSHYELMQKDGLYAKMFHSQADWYKEVIEDTLSE